MWKKILVGDFEKALHEYIDSISDTLVETILRVEGVEYNNFNKRDILFNILSKKLLKKESRRKLYVDVSMFLVVNTITTILVIICISVLFYYVVFRSGL